MKAHHLALSLGAIAGLAAGGASADTSISGICPDGSYFIVQSRASIPCANAHTADPSDLPPVRPYLLPRPYTWYVDQEARSANNPYNLIETARKIREARAGVAPEGSSAGASAARQAPPNAGAPAPVARAESPARAPLVSLADDELRDLVRLIALRQEASPALFDVKDVHGAHSLKIELAHSASFESYALAALGRSAGANHVLVWSAEAVREAEFHPNFFVVQSGRTFRPDPQNPAELAFLLGSAGKLPAGEMAVGYLVVPANFDPAGPLELFWNDRSVEATLAPTGAGAGTSH
ncbi:MAG: hypothetical protein ACHQ6T_08975 [Myxococcota bacterium]